MKQKTKKKTVNKNIPDSSKPRPFIRIVENHPGRDVHVVRYNTVEEARRALLIALNNYGADNSIVSIQSNDKTVILPSRQVACVIAHFNGEI